MLSFLLSTAILSESRDFVPPMREFRAVWVATVANIDWPSKPGLSVEQKKKEMTAILDVCARNHMNAIVFQVRPHGDAMYRSDLEPWSYYLEGEQGKAPEGGWDPLEFLVKEGHRRGIEIHCWLNPFRANHPSQKGPLSDRHYASRHPASVPKYGKFMWMDPGDQDVQDHCYDVFMDVLLRYDIDGIHMDDYFYPYPSYANNADFPDTSSWQKYRENGGGLARGEWRRDNVNRFVKRLYEGVKSTKPWVKVGISPFGIYRPGNPVGVRTTFDQYEKLYADCRLWLQEGWLDYFAPQLYWKINSDQSYTRLLDWWMEQNTQQRHLWPGNNASVLDPSLGGWPVKELENQIALTRERGVGGNVMYSMKPFLLNTKEVNYALRKRAYKELALVPESPWLTSSPPAVPTCFLSSDGASIELAGMQEDGRFYAIYLDKGNGLRLVRVTSEDASGLPVAESRTIAVSVVSKTGVESAMQIVKGA